MYGNSNYMMNPFQNSLRQQTLSPQMHPQPLMIARSSDEQASAFHSNNNYLDEPALPHF
jgi:hypothetical protein